MAFISSNTRVAEHRTRLVCLGESPSPRVRCRLAMFFTYYLLLSSLIRQFARNVILQPLPRTRRGRPFV
jgi:hypothetical protein